MRNNVYTTPIFDNKFKKYRKKFPSLETEIDTLTLELLANPRLGTALGADLYKIRMQARAKGKAKVGVLESSPTL